MAQRTAAVPTCKDYILALHKITTDIQEDTKYHPCHLINKATYWPRQRHVFVTLDAYKDPYPLIASNKRLHTPTHTIHINFSFIEAILRPWVER